MSCCIYRAQGDSHIKKTGVHVGKWKTNVVKALFSFLSLKKPLTMPARSRTLTRNVGFVFFTCNAKETSAAKNIDALSKVRPHPPPKRDEEHLFVVVVVVTIIVIAFVYVDVAVIVVKI